MPWFQLKMHQNAFGGRALPGPAAELTSLRQTLQLDSRGPTSGEGRGNAPNFVSRFGGIEAPASNTVR